MSKKRKQVASPQSSALEDALSKVEEARKALEEAERAVQTVVAKKAVKQFRSLMEATVEARKNLDAAFTTGIDPARCYIYPGGDHDAPCFEIGFFKRSDDIYTIHNVTEMVWDLLEERGNAIQNLTDSEFFFVCGYAKFLLRAFLKRFHRQLAKTVTTLIPLDQLLTKLDEEILDQEAEEEDE